MIRTFEWPVQCLIFAVCACRTGCFFLFSVFFRISEEFRFGRNRYYGREGLNPDDSCTFS